MEFDVDNLLNCIRAVSTLARAAPEMPVEALLVHAAEQRICRSLGDIAIISYYFDHPYDGRWGETELVSLDVLDRFQLEYVNTKADFPFGWGMGGLDTDDADGDSRSEYTMQWSERAAGEIVRGDTDPVRVATYLTGVKVKHAFNSGPIATVLLTGAPASDAAEQ